MLQSVTIKRNRAIGALGYFEVVVERHEINGIKIGATIEVLDGTLIYHPVHYSTGAFETVQYFMTRFRHLASQAQINGTITPDDLIQLQREIEKFAPLLTTTE
jgi:hypothetical protein